MSHLTGFREVARAFFAGDTRKIKNDYTDGQSLYYHGNRIAWRDTAGVHVTLAGWGTSTTRARLNIITARFPNAIGFSQRNWDQYYGEREISTREVITL